METIITMAQLLFSIGTVWGIYKTKVDIQERSKNEITELRERMARIEEKTNFIINQLNNKNYATNI